MENKTTAHSSGLCCLLPQSILFSIEDRKVKNVFVVLRRTSGKLSKVWVAQAYLQQMLLELL